MDSVKEFKTFSEQVDILESRGVLVKSKEDAISKLSNINYYRFTAYLLSYKLDENKYIKDTDFNDVFDLYIFDKELRSIISNSLEDIEITFRTYIAYTIAKNYGPLGYLKSKNFKNKQYHETFIKEFKRSLRNNKEKPFIKHHMLERKGKIPIWVAVEIMSFGMISRLYSNLREEDKIYIRDEFCNLPIQKVKNWFKSLTLLRNHCAHFGRIYNYEFPEISIHKYYSAYDIDKKRLFSNILAMKFLIPNEDAWSKFFIDLQELIRKYNSIVDYDLIGFPKNWVEILSK